MSNTRRAEPGKPLRQERWASSDEFQRGLLANLVARRCSVLKSPADRELIHFLQALSHREGGLQKVAADLVEMFPDRIGTRSMQRFGMKPGQVYTAKQVKAIQAEMPGESFKDIAVLLDGYEPKLEEPQPTRLEVLFDRKSVSDGMLPSLLEELCLNPAVKLESIAPWYFPDLVRCLREFEAACIKKAQDGVVVTEIGRQVYDALDYALDGKCLVLVEGPARMGKTFAARQWVNEHPGRARYVQVPSTNDDISFLRAIASSVGIATGLSIKACELRQRVEDALQAGDLLLVADESHYLWPVGDCRHTLPSRINWLMTALVNLGVPVALVATPQFMLSQKEVEKRTHWTSEQLIGRISHYQKLPSSLGDEDLAKVAKALLPEADAKTTELLVAYAQASAKYLAGIECVVRRARYLARKEQRDQVTHSDIKRAIKDGVMPSDTALARALAGPIKQGRKRLAEPLQGRFMASSERDPATNGGARKPDFAELESAHRSGSDRLNSPRIERELVPA